MRKTILILGFVGIAVDASADPSGFYAGIGIGGSNQIVNFQPSVFNQSTNGSTLNNSNWTFDGRIDAGYKIDSFNSFEAGWMYTTKSSYGLPDYSNSIDLTASTIDLSYIFTAPTKIPYFSVFGRIGAAYNFINSNDVGCNCGTANIMSPSGSNFADVLGAGIKWDVSRLITTKIEWISNGLLFPVGLSSGGTNVANWSSQTFNVGFDYNF